MSENSRNQTVYDPKTVSEMLGIPTATIRRYAQDWSGYLSDYASQSGKKRRYTDQDVLVLKRLRDYIGQRKSREEIAQLLLIVDDRPASALALLPNIISQFEQYDAKLSTHDQRLEELQREIDDLKAEQKRSWLQRLFGKK